MALWETLTTLAKSPGQLTKETCHHPVPFFKMNLVGVKTTVAMKSLRLEPHVHGLVIALIHVLKVQTYSATKQICLIPLMMTLWSTRILVLYKWALASTPRAMKKRKLLNMLYLKIRPQRTSLKLPNVFQPKMDRRTRRKANPSLQR